MKVCRKEKKNGCVIGGGDGLRVRRRRIQQSAELVMLQSNKVGVMRMVEWMDG